MLSGETTVGKYPLKCVEYLDKIARTSEKNAGLNFSEELKPQGAKQQIAIHAVKLADEIKAKGVICITRQGKMARFACSARIQNSPIFAFTFDNKVRQQLNILRSVESFMIEKHETPEDLIEEALKTLSLQEISKPGDRFVVISDLLVKDDVEAIQLRTIR